MTERFSLEKINDEITFTKVDNPQGHGENGFIRSGGLFGRNIQVGDVCLNRGSLIDFLNHDLPDGKKLKKGNWFFGGSPEAKIIEAYNARVAKMTASQKSQEPPPANPSREKSDATLQASTTGPALAPQEPSSSKVETSTLQQPPIKETTEKAFDLTDDRVTEYIEQAIEKLANGEIKIQDGGADVTIEERFEGAAKGARIQQRRVHAAVLQEVVKSSQKEFSSGSEDQEIHTKLKSLVTSEKVITILKQFMDKKSKPDSDPASSASPIPEEARLIFEALEKANAPNCPTEVLNRIDDFIKEAIGTLDNKAKKPGSRKAMRRLIQNATVELLQKKSDGVPLSPPQRKELIDWVGDDHVKHLLGEDTEGG